VHFVFSVVGIEGTKARLDQGVDYTLSGALRLRPQRLRTA
jgi:hypothetical protein